MGKGKGAPEQWVAVIRPGKILFEMEGVPKATAQEAMRLAADKLPLPTKLVAARITPEYEPSRDREEAVGRNNNESRQSTGSRRRRAAQAS